MAQDVAAVRMGPQGRIVVPRALRDALGFTAGDDLVAYDRFLC
jgi:bifunctional DNA-binding transcriptional regulator/antitoxin component of YhaV-PrlF toxin-antitoxin module